MKHSIQKIAIITSCAVLSTCAYANSTLKVENYSGIEMRIATDLTCGLGEHDFAKARYTTPLDENPILSTRGPVTASWKNCAILPLEYYQENHLIDHSKIYVTLVDPVTGDKVIVNFHSSYTADQSREIDFSWYHLFLGVISWGNYKESHTSITLFSA